MFDSLVPYAAIGVIAVIVAGLAAVIMILAHLIGPKRKGPVKDSPYESGVPVVGDTHRRFNIRFYVVALLFLLFDVEIVFLWPWVKAYYQAAAHGATYQLENSGIEVGKNFFLIGMGVFFLLLLIGLIYEWKRGALEWG